MSLVITKASSLKAKSLAYKPKLVSSLTKSSYSIFQFHWRQHISPAVGSDHHHHPDADDVPAAGHHPQQHHRLRGIRDRWEQDSRTPRLSNQNLSYLCQRFRKVIVQKL